jgi:hypothetical protein
VWAITYNRFLLSEVYMEIDVKNRGAGHSNNIATQVNTAQNVDKPDEESKPITLQDDVVELSGTLPVDDEDDVGTGTPPVPAAAGQGDEDEVGTGTPPVP